MGLTQRELDEYREVFDIFDQDKGGTIDKLELSNGTTCWVALLSRAVVASPGADSCTHTTQSCLSSASSSRTMSSTKS